jgi:hypothetical protein
MRKLCSYAAGKFVLVLILGMALTMGSSVVSEASTFYPLGDLEESADASPLYETAWDDDGEPLSFDIDGGAYPGIGVEVLDNTFYNYPSLFMPGELSSSVIPPLDGFLVRTTLESGSIPLVISGDLLPYWEREEDEQIGFLSPDYGNGEDGTISWDFTKDNPDNARLIVGTMYLDESEIDEAPISSDCGVVVVKLEDVNYYFQVWGNVDPDEESAPVLLGVISSNEESFDVLSLDVGSVVAGEEEYEWLALVNLGKKKVTLDSSIINPSSQIGSFSPQQSDADVVYHSSYTPNVADEPAELNNIGSDNLSPAVAVLLQTTKSLDELSGDISIPVSIDDLDMTTSGVARKIQIYFSPADQVEVEQLDEFIIGGLAVTRDVTSTDIEGIEVNSVVSSEDIAALPEDTFKVEEGTGNAVAKFSVDTGSAGFNTNDALPLVVNMEFILEDAFESYKGTTVEDAKTFLLANANFVKTWSDGTTTEIPLDNDAITMRIQKTEEGTLVMLTLHALIVNGGSMGDTEDVTIGELNRAYIAIYDGTDDDSISDPITFEAADDSASSSGNGGCSMTAFPAALLLLLPLVMLKK